MLTFIGLRLYDEKDIKKEYGKRISVLERGDIEENAEEGILKLAKSQKVVLLSGGDAIDCHYAC